MIRFTFFGIPVEIQPWFWVIMALLGSGFGKVGSTANEALNIALFVIAGFISIFIHELGHALTGKFYKARPFIVLHSFGGIAAFPGSQFTRVQSFLVTFAGPLVQIILGIATFVVIYFSQGLSDSFQGFLWDLASISIFWALLNLIPVFPLDGGQMLFAAMGPKRRRLALQVSIGVAVLASIAMMVSKAYFMMPVFMLYYAYQNYQELRNFR
jgi:membrane-associated protease RseP (regulator of RpoE activity)